MPNQLWGTTDSLALSLPAQLLGYLLLSVYLAVAVGLLWSYQAELRRQTRSQWTAVFLLSLLALLLSQLLPLTLPFAAVPVAATQELTPIVAPFATLAPLFAAATLNPAAAFIVGLFSGLGHSLGHSHQLFDIFHAALAATLASHLLRQNYLGRGYHWLRHPVLAGGLSYGATFILLGLAAFANSNSSASALSELDLAISTGNAHLLPLLLEGMFGGLLLLLIFRALPHLRPAPTLAPSPQQRSLMQRLLGNFVLFAVLLLVLLVTVVFTVSLRVSTQLVVDQMAYNASTVAQEIPDFQARAQSLLVEYSQDATLLTSNSDEQNSLLRQLHRTNPVYRRVLLVAANGTILNFYPIDNTVVDLTEVEQTAVSDTLASNAPTLTSAQSRSDEAVVSFIVPVSGGDNQPVAVLIGRVPALSLASLVAGLRGTVGQGDGFIVDEQSRIIAYSAGNSSNASGSDRLLATWQPPVAPRQLRSSSNVDGLAYEGRDEQTNARELVYTIPATNQPWTVVTTAPYDVVLNLAVNIGTPLALVLLLITASFYANLVLLGRDITTPIGQLVEATRAVAAGRPTDLKIHKERSDELGQLSKAFADMQTTLKQRVDDLSLLLSISTEVSNSMDLSEGMPAILKGALRGTRAIGARAIILNPNTPHPFQFGEGPRAEAMSVLDRVIMARLRHSEDSTLSNPSQIQQQLEPGTEMPLPVQALIAIPLSSPSGFRGLLWLGYAQPHQFNDGEINLLRTLARQTAVLVENAYNFARAEGGRRRLAAVLSSTPDAVIVTDQTNRIHLVNPAFESTFGQKGTDLMGRTVSDMIEIPPLAEALLSPDKRPRNFEIPLDDGRTFYTSASPIIGNDGYIVGRVAVLHDITHFKELDELKSDFVSTVSHDLRSPLTYMRGYATMLSMAGELNDQQSKYTEKILGGIDQMAMLVNNLLDLGRIEAGIELVFEPVEIDQLLQTIAEEHWQHAHMQGIKLKVDAPADLPTIRGDKALIRQAVTNLLTNGIKYAPQSGEMLLRAEQSHGQVIIAVQDRGPGISEKDQLRLFEKFYRVKRRGTEKIKGSGLGLAIVRSIAERHGGRAWCQSQLDKGSTFYLALPIEPKVGVNGRGEKTAVNTPSVK
ncbi:MAG: ATP-binding protein [Chloroflexota bacterium]